MIIDGKKLKYIFNPPTRAEYEYILGRLFKLGYVFDPKRLYTNIEDVWACWRRLEIDYPFLAVYEGTNVTDSYSSLERVYWKLIVGTPFVDSFPPYVV